MNLNPDDAPTREVQIGRKARKNIVDWLTVEGVAWSGRLAEEAFLDRFVDLDDLPSTDSRFPNARYDLRQHRVSNYDWDDDWVYSYEPLNLVGGDDAIFGRFLCEMVHPIVRPESDEARRLVGELNDLLKVDGLEMFQSGSIGARPTFGIRSVASSRSRHSSRGRAPEAEPSTNARSDDGEHRLWEAGMLRLFVSHISSHKVEIAALKGDLRRYGVDSFVAHEDIEPSLEWQAEIEEALRSMHAMSAILTDDFHDSKWTDQEVGIALGLGVLIVPVRAPDVPYGFMESFKPCAATYRTRQPWHRVSSTCFYDGQKQQWSCELALGQASNDRFRTLRRRRW